MKVTQAHYESEGHVILTGPIQGSLTLEDGTEYDVSDAVVEIDPAHADELAHLIGQHYAENGHPEVDGDFTYDAPQEG